MKIIIGGLILACGLDLLYLVVKKVNKIKQDHLDFIGAVAE